MGQLPKEDLTQLHFLREENPNPGADIYQVIQDGET